MVKQFAAWMVAGYLAVGVAAAQGTGATLAGTVLDATKAAMPGVTVTVRQVETGARRVLVSDGQGRFQAPSLESGTYEVSAELSGFQTAVRDGLQLSVGQHVTVSLTMQVGQVGERIVVTGDAPMVETRRGGLASLVDERQIRDLPLNGRDFSQLTLLQPGIVASVSTDRTLDRGMGTQISVAGARPNQISYVLDGADVNFQGNQSPGSAAGGLLGVDTVREFQVLVNNYSAEYGRSSGGIVTAITRSGTNAFQGSAFEFFRNDALTARNYFAAAGQPKPTLDRNQFGGLVGGPLRKDKIFFGGPGHTIIQQEGKQPQRVDWGHRSLFSVPLNVRYQHFNDRDKPVRLVAVTSFPFIMNSTDSEKFVFENPFRFTDRYDAQEDYLKKNERLRTRETATNIVKDALDFKLEAWNERGQGSTNMGWDMAGNSQIDMHVSEMPSKLYKAAHRHSSDAFVLLLSGEGYSITWPEGQYDKRVRVNWQEGTLFVPPIYWYHQHLNPGDGAARYLAINAPPIVRNLGLRFQDQLEPDLPEIEAEFKAEVAKYAPKPK